MSAVTCDWCRGLLIGDATAARAHEDIAAHLDGCGECRAFAEALRFGEQAWRTEDHDAFCDGVLARTSEAEALAVELRELAEMDPGPGFTERVLLHTSRRPTTERWWVAWVSGWRALTRRPRFAWEAAYVATLCLVLAVGNPVSAWEWGSQTVTSLATRRIAPATSTLRQDLEAWRAALATDLSSASPAPGVAASEEPRGVFEAAWQSASNWVRGRLAQIVDAFIGLWQGAAAWLDGPEPAGQSAAGTEPRGGSARSPQ